MSTTVEAAIHENPGIFGQQIKKQLSSLILNPIKASIQSPNMKGHQRQCVVIIDGLDQCAVGSVQGGIILAISDALRTLGGSPYVHQNLPRFLICSRTGVSIERVFRFHNLQGMYKVIELNGASTAAADMTNFFKAHFDEIKRTHPSANLLPSSWPSDTDISNLRNMTADSFIHAANIMEFLATHPDPVIGLSGTLGWQAVVNNLHANHGPLLNFLTLFHRN